MGEINNLLDGNFIKHGFYHFLPVTFQKKVVISMLYSILKMLVSITHVGTNKQTSLRVEVNMLNFFSRTDHTSSSDLSCQEIFLSSIALKSIVDQKPVFA